MTNEQSSEASLLGPDSIRELVENAAGAVHTGTLEQQIDQTNEALGQADSPVSVIGYPPITSRTLEEIVERVKTRTPEERALRRQELEVMTGSSLAARRRRVRAAQAIVRVKAGQNQ